MYVLSLWWSPCMLDIGLIGYLWLLWVIMKCRVSGLQGAQSAGPEQGLSSGMGRVQSLTRGGLSQGCPRTVGGRRGC